MVKTVITAVLCVIASHQASAQHSLLYEVSGNGLKKSSYLFGTFHLLTESFVDSQAVVMKKLKASKAVAGEVITDSLMAVSTRILPSLAADTPIDKLLSVETYASLNKMTYDLLGMDAAFLKNLPPTVINVMLLQRMYTMHFNPPSGEQLMDVYIQNIAREQKKKIIGLESVEHQVDMLFKQPLHRQAEQLEDFILEKDSFATQVETMLLHYRRADYDKLMELMYDEDFTPQEIDRLVFQRNAAWLEKLPNIMKDQPTFVAVGAMHLAGENGLVEELRKRGYTVTPLPLQ